MSAELPAQPNEDSQPVPNGPSDVMGLASWNNRAGDPMLTGPVERETGVRIDGLGTTIYGSMDERTPIGDPMHVLEVTEPTPGSGQAGRREFNADIMALLQAPDPTAENQPRSVAVVRGEQADGTSGYAIVSPEGELVEWLDMSGRAAASNRDRPIVQLDSEHHAQVFWATGKGLAIWRDEADSHSGDGVMIAVAGFGSEPIPSAVDDGTMAAAEHLPQPQELAPDTVGADSSAVAASPSEAVAAPEGVGEQPQPAGGVSQQLGHGRPDGGILDKDGMIIAPPPDTSPPAPVSEAAQVPHGPSVAAGETVVPAMPMNEASQPQAAAMPVNQPRAGRVRQLLKGLRYRGRHRS